MTDPQQVEYKMKSDLFDFNELKKDPNFTVLRLGDAVYMGTLKDKGSSTNKRHGRGIMKYK